MNFVKTFWNDDRGQDTVEYSLLLGFVALAAAGILISMGTDVTAIFSITRTHLNNAAKAASSSAGGS